MEKVIGFIFVFGLALTGLILLQYLLQIAWEGISADLDMEERIAELTEEKIERERSNS